MEPENGNQPVQPDPAAAAGQGQGQPPSEGLYPDLSAVPEGEPRDKVLSALKEWEANVTRRFQDAAEYRKKWEPYESLGLHDIEVDDLQELLAFRDVASDPEQFRTWYDAIGREMGFAPEQDSAPEPNGGDLDGLEQVISKALDSRLGPIEQAYQQQEEARRLQEAESFVQTKLDALAGEHGDFDRDAVCQLALAYDSQDAIERGFADYQRLIGAAEQSLLKNKLNQPETPEQGGKAASAPPEIKTFEAAKAAAREMARQAMSH